MGAWNSQIKNRGVGAYMEKPSEGTQIIGSSKMGGGGTGTYLG